MADPTGSWIMMALLATPLARISEQRFRSLPELSPATTLKRLPSLSIIVPARNEEYNLQRLLPSLRTLTYPGPWELIVVDDNSSDGTARLAQAHGAQVIGLNNLPEGWLGKTYASHQGALSASGDWLLFTDADTVHDSCGPAQAVNHALTNKLDGLSVFIGQDHEGLMDRLTLSVAFAGLFSGLSLRQIPINGQYLLLRRDVYTSSGGFSSVANERLEDLALGHQLSACNYRIQILRSEKVARVRMYVDKTDLWHGLVRLGAGSLRWLGIRSLLTALFVTGVMSPILAIISTFGRHRHRKWAVASWLAVTWGFLPWGKRFGSASLALMAPIGALIVQFAAVWGLLSQFLGRGIRWKGRRV